jgi:hypothetical protein
MSGRAKGNTTRRVSLAMTVLLCGAASCSSGAQGPLVDCVAPGAACCAEDACAVGLTCENGVCVAVDAGGAEDAATLEASAPPDATMNDSASRVTDTGAALDVVVFETAASVDSAAVEAGL